VRSAYTGNNSTALNRLYYNRTGFTACFDKYQVGNGCFAQSPTPSDSLVGFNGVVVDTQKPNGSGGWATVARQKEEYNIANYWLNGKTTKSQQLNPATSAVLAETISDWQTGGNPAWQARLMQQDQYIYAEATLHTYQTYSYDASYGAVYEVRQYRQDTSGNTLYRCTQNAYVHQAANPIWLINRPIRQTTYAGNCGSTKVTETLYRYDGSTTPSATALNGKAALERTLTWLGQTTADTRYVTSRVVYNANGLPQYTYTYNDYSDRSTNTYASNVRNTQQIVSYSSLGLPVTIQTSATGVTTSQSQTMGYETLRPWLVTAITDANSDTTSYEYDKFGRLRKVVRPGDSTGSPTLEYRYSDDSTVTGVGFTVPLFTEVRTKNNLQQPPRSFYNGLGQLLQTQQAHAEVGTTAADKDIVVTYAYDERGLTTCQTYPYDVTPYTGTGHPFRSADNCLNYAHTDTNYDTLGRVYSVTVPDGSRSVYHYGTATVGTQIYTYQDVIDPNRHRTVQFTDAFGRLVQVAEFSGDCGSYWASEGFGCSGNYTTPWATYATTSYAYNQRDQLTSVTDAASNVTTMTYNALGHKLTMSDPDMGNWSYGYDPAGNLVAQLDAKGQLIDFTYDGFNRITGKAYYTTVLATYTYDQVTGSNNGIGRLTRVDDLAGYHTFIYDNRGQVTSETQVIGSNSYVMQYSYDALDRMTSMTYPNGEVVTTGYNNQGLPESLSGTNSYVPAATYNRMGQFKSLTLGNNLTTWYGYHGYEAFGQNDTYDVKEVTWNWLPAGNNYGQLWRTCTSPYGQYNLPGS
jgi:YD repeat-containing protein